jgi:hypothetical protein
MRRFIVICLFVANCFILCLGCSSVKSPQEQSAISATPPPHKQITPQFIKNWWDDPPPYSSLGNTNGGWGWYYFVGVPLEVLGPFLTK